MDAQGMTLEQAAIFGEFSVMWTRG